MQLLKLMFHPGLFLTSRLEMYGGKHQISDDNTILTTGMVPQYPSGVSCTAQWDKSEEPIKFQRVVLKEDARTKFGGSNPMQPTVVEWERKISEADHSR